MLAINSHDQPISLGPWEPTDPPEGHPGLCAGLQAATGRHGISPG